MTGRVGSDMDRSVQVEKGDATLHATPRVLESSSGRRETLRGRIVFKKGSPPRVQKAPPRNGYGEAGFSISPGPLKSSGSALRFGEGGEWGLFRRSSCVDPE